MAQSVLSAIPLYPMQMFFLPMELCSEIEKITRTFLLGGKAGEQKVSLVGWSNVTKKKEHGGIGIKRMHDMNLAFLAKLGWRLLNESSSLWVRVLWGKYMRNNFDIEHISPKQNASNAWKGIVKAKDVLVKRSENDGPR